MRMKKGDGGQRKTRRRENMKFSFFRVLGFEVYDNMKRKVRDASNVDKR